MASLAEVTTARGGQTSRGPLRLTGRTGDSQVVQITAATVANPSDAGRTLSTAPGSPFPSLVSPAGNADVAITGDGRNLGDTRRSELKKSDVRPQPDGAHRVRGDSCSRGGRSHQPGGGRLAWWRALPGLNPHPRPQGSGAQPPVGRSVPLSAPYLDLRWPMSRTIGRSGSGIGTRATWTQSRASNAAG